MNTKELSKKISSDIYQQFGSGTGVLFGIPSSLREAVESVIELTLRAKTVKKSLLFVEHIESHEEVKNAYLNPCVPMCKICEKTIDEIYLQENGKKNNS